MNRPHYTLLKENCYWFAGIILAVMSRVVQKLPELHSDPRATVQMGAWRALIAIFKENNTNVVAMVNSFWEQYTNEISTFTAQIVELQETRRLASTAGEEKARADALAEQVDEEKARANGALSRAEALAEQVDEEKARAARAISRAEALEAFMRSQGLSLPDGLTLN
ncbi:hypothetical protein H0H93_016671 [Arthromyces matolae]|nr:hypothetical protein H0H93_016671 [Arthromyces matolae]